MLKLTDVDVLKMALQSHFDVVEQDCSMSDEYREGVVAGLNAAMFEIDSTPTIDAIPMWWITEKFLDVLNKDKELSKAVWLVRKAWQKEQGGREREHE